MLGDSALAPPIALECSRPAHRYTRHQTRQGGDDAAAVAATLAGGLGPAQARPLQLVVPAWTGDRVRLPVPPAPAVAARSVQPPLHLDGGVAGHQLDRGGAAARMVARCRCLAARR